MVSKEHKLEIVQDKIGDKIGISNDTWKQKEQHEKAEDISRLLSAKKFVLFFTTRSEDVCGHMDAQKKIKLECLTWEKAWNLFQKKVGRETLLSHPDIHERALTVAKECGGLPLALITAGRAMSCKKTPQEWNHAIHVLKNSASKFTGMEDKVFRLLKFSYDSLADERIKSCLLYCAIFPEDYIIDKDDLLYFWMCEGMLDEYGKEDEAKNKCYDIIGTLAAACLLEVHNNEVKVHDLIHDMALWLARACGKENNSILVHTSADGVLDVENWKDAQRVSLIYSNVERLTETPKPPKLLTLLIEGPPFERSSLNMITNGFFDHMRTLRVLDLSSNVKITKLPSGVSNLISLQYLNLSRTGIRQLPVGLKALVRLKYLNLERMYQLDRVPPDLISSFPKLEVLRMILCGSEGILFGGERALIEEIESLKHLQVLSLSVRSCSCFEKLFSYHILSTCSLSLHLSIGNNHSNIHDISSLADMNLYQLYISDYPNLKELEIYWAGRAPNDPRNTMMTNHSRFCGLEYVSVRTCPNLKDLTLLIFASNLSRLIIFGSPEMEKIIDLERLGGVAEVVKEQNPYGKFTVLYMSSLPLLKSIYDNALPSPHLNEIKAYRCPALKKLPLNSTSVNAKSSSLIIEGWEEWWNGEDEVARSVFRPCFRLNPF